MLIPILLGAGIFTRKQLDSATEYCQEKDVSLETALEETGISKTRLTASTDALAQVEEKKITLDLAIRAVRMVAQRDINLSEALKIIANNQRGKSQALGGSSFR